MKGLITSLLISLVALSSDRAAERFACDMNTLTSSERTRHQELSRTLLAEVQEKKELKNGYAFRLPSETLMKAAEWVSFERKCCPFFTFEMEQARDRGPLWLRITGSEGVKAFIREEFQF